MIFLLIQEVLRQQQTKSPCKEEHFWLPIKVPNMQDTVAEISQNQHCVVVKFGTSDHHLHVTHSYSDGLIIDFLSLTLTYDPKFAKRQLFDVWDVIRTRIWEVCGFFLDDFIQNSEH